jgi:threonylcarbamoyladenosine tRNA methylthiotransferase MtaB
MGSGRGEPSGSVTSGKPFRVYFRTFGCKANQYDTERMRQELEALGAQATDGAGEAHLCVVNTCTVTNQADADARRFIRRVQRVNPGIRVVVAGCSSALKPQVYREMEGVVGVVEGHDPVDVARSALLGMEEKGEAPVPLVQLGIWRPLDRSHHGPVGSELLNRREGGTRGWLKVQDGCDRKCSFCATRLARGASRSRPPEEVLAEARLLARNHPELVITGIHIGHYGRDLQEPKTLSGLVASLLDELPGVRLRLGSVEATEVDDLLLELLATSEGGLAPHLHMPMQSGSDAVLKGMRRWHTREDYRRRALEIAETIPVLGLGADIITGFPGETEEDHALTRALVEELPFTYLHVFPFSPRDDTAAAELPEPIPQRIAGERSRELRELGLEKGRAYRDARSGTRARVVLEGEGGWALTEDYLRVEVGSPDGSLQGPPGTFRPDALHEGLLRGEGVHLYIDLSPSSRLIEREDPPITLENQGA